MNGGTDLAAREVSERTMALVRREIERATSFEDLRATEVTSMGYERLAEKGGLERLATKDPEMLFFLLGQLGGR